MLEMAKVKGKLSHFTGAGQIALLDFVFTFWSKEMLEKKVCFR